MAKRKSSKSRTKPVDIEADKKNRAELIDRTIPRLEFEGDAQPGVSLAAALSNVIVSLMTPKMPILPDLSSQTEAEKVRVISLFKQRVSDVEKEARENAQPLLWKKIYEGQRVLFGRMGGRLGPQYEFTPADMPFTIIEREEGRNFEEPEGLSKKIVFATNEVSHHREARR